MPGWILIGVVTTMSAGCVSLAAYVFPENQDSDTLKVGYEPGPDGLRIRLESRDPLPDRTFFALGGRLFWGGGADLLVGANLPLAIFKFSDTGSAYAIATLAAGALLAGDLALSQLLTPKPSPSDVWLARVGTSGHPLAAVPLTVSDVTGGRRVFVGVAAVPENVRELPLDVEIINPAGRIARRETKSFLVGSWATARPGESAPATAYVPAATIAADSLEVDAPPTPLGKPDPHAAAIVIGVERYGGAIPGVAYAERDATAIRSYFERVLRVPPENILFLQNEKATKGAIETAVEAQLPAILGDDPAARVFVYFAGHGAPDIQTRTAYLVPHDGNPDFPAKSCYALDTMYRALGSLKARSVTVFLDACFTGVAARNDGVALLAGARPLFVTPVDAALPANLTVLAAATGQQISSTLEAKRHGLFTYYLLRGLRGEAFRGGLLTVSDLAAYVGREVPGQARRLGRQQTPVLLGDGRDRPLASR